MIYAITGKPGTGKSYFLVRLTKKLLEQGTDVYANIRIDERRMDLHAKNKSKTLGRLYYWNSLGQFRYINNGIVMLDEAGAYFEPREWAKFSIEDRVKFQQHRKQKLDIYLTVQNFNRVDAVIRQLTNIVYDIHHVGKLFWYNQYAPEEIDLKKRKSMGTSLYLFDKKIADSYDTFETVNMTEKVTFKFKPMASFFVSHV